MSDNVKQTGKYLGTTAKKRNIALQRVAPIIPITDRVRDIFDSVNGVDMVFNKPKEHTRVSMDLRFLKLPFNQDNLCGECHCRSAEYFAGGESTYTISHIFDSSTVRVYIDNIRTTNFLVTGPSSIELLDTTTTANKVSITYVFKYDAQCSTGTDIPNYEGDVFTGIQRANDDPSDLANNVIFTNSFDNPGAGESGYPTTGPCQTDQTGYPYRTITFLQPMVIRVMLRAQFATVSNPGAYAQIVLMSSMQGALGSDTAVKSWPGLGYFSTTLSVDVRNLQVSAGETFSCQGYKVGFLIGGWGNSGGTSTWLMGGRGSISTIGFSFNGP